MRKLLILFLICAVQNIFSQKSSTSKNVKTKDNPIVQIPEGYFSNDQSENSNNSTKSSSVDYDAVFINSGVEVLPNFPGGIDQFYKYVYANFQYPEKNLELKGKIYVNFIIEKDGSLTDIKLLRDLGHGTGDETIRVLKTSPKWIPGKKDGKVVRVLHALAITLDR